MCTVFPKEHTDTNCLSAIVAMGGLIVGPGPEPEPEPGTVGSIRRRTASSKIPKAG